MIRSSPVAAALLALAAPAALAQQALLARNLAATCANCHGTLGIARGEMKSIAGQPAAQLLQALADFKSGARPSAVMQQITKGYTDEQLRLIAGHYAALPPGKAMP